MRKVYLAMLIFVLTLLTVFPATGGVSAESAITDGEYELPFEVLQAEKDEKSAAGDFVENPAKLIVENDTYTVQMTIKSADMWQSFQVASGGSFVEVTEVSKDEEADTSTVQFDVANLEEILDARAHIIVAGLYDMIHDVRIKFDTSNISPAPETDGIDLANGNYTIEFKTLHESEDKPSTADGYLKKPAVLSVHEGKGKLSLTLTDHEAIKDFKTEQNGEFVSADIVTVNEAANTRIVAFDIDNLEEIINGKVKVYVAQMDYTGEYGIRLQLDKNSIEEFDGNVEEETPTDLTNGNYTINYRVLHETDFEKSRMAGYMVAPAKLVLNEDQKTITITLKDHEAITDFQIEKNGEFQSVKDLNVDEAENTRDVSFEIDDLNAVVNAKVKVFVKEANYSSEHVVRIFFEENSVKDAEPFTDIKGHWAEEYILTSYQNDWFKGYADGRFGPEDSVKRMQAASLFVRILELTDSKAVPFTDVRTIEAETIAELEKAYANGVVNGFPDGSFKPYADVTRAQFALMIYRSYEKETGAPYEPKQAADFSDIAAYDQETKDAIAMLKELGIAEGSQGKFSPKNSATRAHAAKMLVNYKEVLDDIK